MQYIDYYKILGVSKEATQDDIQRAYRKRARTYHPDVNKSDGAESKFKEINEAKEVLSDPEKRKLYDQYGMEWQRAAQEESAGWEHSYQEGDAESGFFRGFDFGESSRNGTGPGFSDFFQDLFGGRSSTQRPGAGDPFTFNIPGANLEADISLSLSDLVQGGQKVVSFQYREEGSGSSYTLKDKSLKVRIPKGVTDGSIIRLAGQGGKGQGQGPDGDLLLRVLLAFDPNFDVRGHDLYKKVALAPWEGVLGAAITVETLTGSVKLTVPPRTQNGRRFRLKGQGLPKKRGVGDLYVEIELRIPDTLDDKEMELFRELAAHSTFDPRGENRTSTEKQQRAA